MGRVVVWHGPAPYVTSLREVQLSWPLARVSRASRSIFCWSASRMFQRGTADAAPPLALAFRKSEQLVWSFPIVVQEAVNSWTSDSHPTALWEKHAELAYCRHPVKICAYSDRRILESVVFQCFGLEIGLPEKHHRSCSVAAGSKFHRWNLILFWALKSLQSYWHALATKPRPTQIREDAGRSWVYQVNHHRNDARV